MCLKGHLKKMATIHLWWRMMGKACLKQEKQTGKTRRKIVSIFCGKEGDLITLTRGDHIHTDMETYNSLKRLCCEVYFFISKAHHV